MTRLAFNKVLPSVFSKPAFANLGYSQDYVDILEAGQATTRSLMATFVAISTIACFVVARSTGAV